MTHTTRRALALVLRLALMATVAANVILMAIVIGLTVVQFRWIERKVEY